MQKQQLVSAFSNPILLELWGEDLKPSSLIYYGNGTGLPRLARAVFTDNIPEQRLKNSSFLNRRAFAIALQKALAFLVNIQNKSWS